MRKQERVHGVHGGQSLLHPVGRITREGILGERMVMLHRNGMEDMLVGHALLTSGKKRKA
ncbi:hypothetical protein A7L29_18765 [Acinetobacter baumannii]|nr:hypothetical protein A7L29_18765 [Acinetobacter baumannii]